MSTRKMSRTGCLGLLICGLWLPWPSRAAGREWVRSLPDAYVPARTMTVTLAQDALCGGTIFRGAVLEIIPPGWSLEWAEIPPTNFDQDTGRIYWDLEVSTWCGLWISYEVTPPADQTGEVSFDGWLSGTPTTGDTALMGRQGVIRRVPADYPTIQAGVDASLFGDTVLVSNKGAAYVENVRMKQGVSLSGAGIPIVQAARSGPLWSIALLAAPNASIAGIHLSSGITGIYIGSRNVELSNCLITEMEAEAVGYHLAGTGGRVRNCTIVGNRTGVDGLSSSPELVLVTNCVFQDNQQDVQDAHVTFSCLQDEIPGGSGENNIFADPMFVDPDRGYYRLRPGSPCIDAGDNSAVSAGEVDLAGNPRIMFGGKSFRVDMGAYEHPSTTLTLDTLSGEPRLIWPKAPWKAYSIFFSEDLITWHLADDVIPSAGNVSVWSDPIGWPPAIPIRFYRITEDE